MSNRGEGHLKLLPSGRAVVVSPTVAVRYGHSNPRVAKSTLDIAHFKERG